MILKNTDDKSPYIDQLEQWLADPALNASQKLFDRPMGPLQFMSISANMRSQDTLKE